MACLRHLLVHRMTEVWDMYDDGRRGGSVFGAFLLGGMIGAVLGTLFAPRSGKETREMIAERSQDYVDQARDTYEEGREKLVEAVSTAKETATERAEELKGQVDEARDTLKTKVDEAAVAARGKVTEFGKDARSGIKTGAGVAKEGVDVAADTAKDALDAVEKAAAPGAEPTA